MNTKLYVGNLSFNTTEMQLQDAFAAHGPVSEVNLMVDRATGQIHIGKVPPYSVVVPGNIGGGPDRPSTYCAVIVKTVDERTRSKTSINELLRD